MTTYTSDGMARRTGRAAANPPRVRVLEGSGILAELGEEFDTLARLCGAPITARRPWLEAWIQSYGEYRPVAVAVFDEHQTLRAVGLFGVSAGGLRTEIVALGHGASDRSRLYTRDAAAGAELAVAVKSWLRTLARPWRMTLAQFAPDDEGLNALRDALAHRVMLAAPGSPMVLIGEDRTPGRYITANYRGQANNKWNRMVKDGLRPEIGNLTSAEEIAPVLPLVMEIAGIRQEELTGQRKLDQPHHARFFQAVVLAHAARGEVELMLLRIGGEIGAYSLTFRDGAAARMWSSHYHPTWSDYSPGHILSRALVERCVACPDIDVLDWMKGLEPYKLRTANQIDPAHTLRAWSGWGGRVVGQGGERLRGALQRLRARYPVLRRLQIALRQRFRRNGKNVVEGGQDV